MTDPIPSGSTQTASISVAGALPFHSAPITVAIDATGTVLEFDERNNSLSTSDSCRMAPTEPGVFDVVQEPGWEMPRIGNGYFDNVMSTPAVAQLTDDNGNGLIDERDTPDLVFVTFQGENWDGQGVLRALSGSDGARLWNSDESSPERVYVNALNGPAVGDIDGDGQVEIVTGDWHHSGLIAFEHDGTVKRQTGNIGARSTSPALADLDGDGQVEILYSNGIYNADGSLRALYSGLPSIFYAPLPVPVDLDGDGEQEIYLQGRAYDHGGNEVWNSGTGGLYGAVGNFDDDEAPEIAAIVSRSALVLIDETAPTRCWSIRWWSTSTATTVPRSSSPGPRPNPCACSKQETTTGHAPGVSGTSTPTKSPMSRATAPSRTKPNLPGSAPTPTAPTLGSNAPSAPWLISPSAAR